MKPVIILGGGGHARVLLGMLRRLNVEILGIVDPHRPVAGDYLGAGILGDDSVIFDYACDQVELVNGVGSVPGDIGLRVKLFGKFQQHGYRFKTLIDPRAFIADDAEMAEGVQVMAGVIIQSGAKIAYNCIVNSGAIVEHDCRIGSHVHIAPGAVLCGGVDIGDNVHIGTGATVIQNITIGAGGVIGAGSVVTRDVGCRRIVYPARSHVRDLQ